MKIILSLLLFVSFCGSTLAQVPAATGLRILKAEDARRYDAVLEGLMRSPNADVRKRAALAAGRIGDAKAITLLSELLEKDQPTDVRLTAAFAIGEVESINGADAILAALKTSQLAAVTARAVEAAGKIAQANVKDERSKDLGRAIFELLNGQAGMGTKRDIAVTRLALTAALRARPDGADAVVVKFLSDSDASIRSDALNVLARLRSKTGLEAIRSLLRSDGEGSVRANAARVLGAAEDQEAVNVLLEAATGDTDSRVRVSAIRALGTLKDAKAADKLIERGNNLLIPMHGDPRPLVPGKKIGIIKPIEIPLQKNELLEIASALGRLLKDTSNENAVNFLKKLRIADKFESSETEIAFATIAPDDYFSAPVPTELAIQNPIILSAYAQGLAATATGNEIRKTSLADKTITDLIVRITSRENRSVNSKVGLALPELLRALAQVSPPNLFKILREQLTNDDPYVRAAVAELLGDRISSKENIDGLKAAFASALLTDKMENDAQLAILAALAKLDKNAGVGTFTIALNATDYLVRKKAFEILADKELQKDFPGLPLTLENARIKNMDKVLPFAASSGTKLGQVLNINTDYRRALGRKNGSVSAVLTTEKGVFTIVFDPEEAPLTVDNFVKLARSGYFNGLKVHRVVPNFVMQDGDPRGDGNGGPGWSIRCEMNTLPFDRGAVGMALSGKDTGGSQWFVTHSAQPHLDGGYTVFGHVTETDMKVVDSIVKGDKILNVKILGR